MTKQKQADGSKVFIPTILTGFIGGVFWGIICLIIYYFNFLEITPKMYVLKSWITSEWVNTYVGDIVSIFIISILSIGVAFVYYALFRRINSIWIGLFYGMLLWGMIFIIFQPFFPNVPSIFTLKKETVISSMCLFILYGTFIGYSISYKHYEDEMFKK